MQFVKYWNYLFFDLMSYNFVNFFFEIFFFSIKLNFKSNNVFYFESVTKSNLSVALFISFIDNLKLTINLKNSDF